MEEMRIVSESSPTRRLITARLTEGIIHGRFQPGTRLIERELCEMLGVSRTSLREALRELERDGLIENIPNKGPIVARITPEQAQGLYEVRGALEGLAAKLFAERASDVQMKRLEVALERLGEVFHDFGNTTPKDFFAAADAFYGILLEGAQNETLAKSLKGIYSRVSQLRLVALQRPGRAEGTYRELKRMFKLIKARAGDDAQQETIRHVQSAAAAALTAMREAQKLAA